jgi:hypothetical protein
MRKGCRDLRLGGEAGGFVSPPLDLGIWNLGNMSLNSKLCLKLYILHNLSVDVSTLLEIPSENKSP